MAQITIAKQRGLVCDADPIVVKLGNSFLKAGGGTGRRMSIVGCLRLCVRLSGARVNCV